MSSETKLELGAHPLALAFDLPCGRLVAVHGSPASTSEYLTDSTHELVLLERAARAGCDILACGHSRAVREALGGGAGGARGRYAEGARVSSALRRPRAAARDDRAKDDHHAGSVGEPRHGGVEATYAILDTRSGDVELCQVRYDVEKTIHAMRQRDVPEQISERLRRGDELIGKRKEIFCAC